MFPSSQVSGFYCLFRGKMFRKCMTLTTDEPLDEADEDLC